MSAADLNRFLTAQENTYRRALTEIQMGRKQSHWMWFIFPQLAGLGLSETSRYYAISNLEEATQYLQHPVLGARLVEISSALMTHNGLSALQIFGHPDDHKLHSSMTLFSLVRNGPSIFEQVLKKYFDGEKDEKTLVLSGIH